jgi:hypothetical protein
MYKAFIKIKAIGATSIKTIPPMVTKIALKIKVELIPNL